MKPEQDYGYNNEREVQGQHAFDEITRLIPILTTLYQGDPLRQKKDGGVWLLSPGTKAVGQVAGETIDHAVAIGPGLTLQTDEWDSLTQFMFSLEKNEIQEVSTQKTKWPLLSKKNEKKYPANSRSAAVAIAPWSAYCRDYLHTVLTIVADRGATLRVPYVMVQGQEKQLLQQRLRDPLLAQQIVDFAHYEAKQRRLLIDLPKGRSEFTLLQALEDGLGMDRKFRRDIVGYENLPPAGAFWNYDLSDR